MTNIIKCGNIKNNIDHNNNNQKEYEQLEPQRQQKLQKKQHQNFIMPISPLSPNADFLLTPNSSSTNDPAILPNDKNTPLKSQASKNHSIEQPLKPQLPLKTSQQSNTLKSHLQQNTQQTQQKPQASPQNPSDPKTCTACDKLISDRYLLSTMDNYWHVQCLRCSCCKVVLSEVAETCFSRNGMILCKPDYIRIFGQPGSCNSCKQSIPAHDYVMKTSQGCVYHVNCFFCVTCGRTLLPGEKYGVYEGNLFCENDYWRVVPGGNNYNNINKNNINNYTSNNYLNPENGNHIESTNDISNTNVDKNIPNNISNLKRPNLNFEDECYSELKPQPHLPHPQQNMNLQQQHMLLAQQQQFYNNQRLFLDREYHESNHLSSNHLYNRENTQHNNIKMSNKVGSG